MCNGLGPLHIVSAWASEHGIVLGQVATEEKSNEITAIPLLLKQIELKKAVITIDAMGCQKDIARDIVDFTDGQDGTGAVLDEVGIGSALRAHPGAPVVPLLGSPSRATW